MKPVCRKHDPLSLLTTVAVFGPVPSHGQAKDLVVNQGLRPFEFSGELNPECRHFCEYVPNARISRAASEQCNARILQSSASAIPDWPSEKCLGMRILPAGDKPC